MPHREESEPTAAVTERVPKPEQTRDDLERHLIDAWRRGQQDEALEEESNN